MSVDPLAGKYPFYTPYQYAGNKPINFIDLDGLESNGDLGQDGNSQDAGENPKDNSTDDTPELKMVGSKTYVNDTGIAIYDLETDNICRGTISDLGDGQVGVIQPSDNGEPLFIKGLDVVGKIIGITGVVAGASEFVFSQEVVKFFRPTASAVKTSGSFYVLERSAAMIKDGKLINRPITSMLSKHTGELMTLDKAIESSPKVGKLLPRSASAAKFFRVVGWGAVIFSAGVSVVDYTLAEEHTASGAVKIGVDTVVGIMGMIGGTEGFVFSVAYFAVDQLYPTGVDGLVDDIIIKPAKNLIFDALHEAIEKMDPSKMTWK